MRADQENVNAAYVATNQHIFVKRSEVREEKNGRGPKRKVTAHRNGGSFC